MWWNSTNFPVHQEVFGSMRYHIRVILLALAFLQTPDSIYVYIVPGVVQYIQDVITPEGIK